MAEVFGRGVVWWEFDATDGPAPPSTKLDTVFPVSGHGRAFGYEGFASGATQTFQVAWARNANTVIQPTGS